METKNIIKCTPEQYEKLLTDRQIEIDGVVREYDENTLYDTGYLNFIEWHNKIMDAQHRQYEVNHSPMNMKSLEQEYNELIEKDSALAYISAIGYNTILEKGNKIVVNEPNKGDFYIDGEKVEADYTYSGDGYEAVNVWVFEHISEDGTVLPPTLIDKPTFDVIELDVRNISQIPVVGDSYKNYATTLRTYNYTIDGVATRKLVSNGVGTFNQKKFSSTIEEVESDCTTLDSTVGGINGQARLKKAIFPNLETIKGTPIGNCTNSALVFYYPKLKTIIGGESSNTATFLYIPNVVLPPSVQIIKNGLFRHNQTITLNCNKAQSISSNWCFSAPAENFTMCSDWQADINIATASANHTIDWFFPRYDDITGELLYETPLFTHILHNFTIDNENLPEGTEPHTGSIKLPATIYEQMTDADRELASSIGWDLLDDPYKTSEV